jgi:ABC-type lipoprotein export system ATPase subunit
MIHRECRFHLFWMKYKKPEVILAIVPTGQRNLHHNLDIKKAVIIINKATDAVIVTHPYRPISKDANASDPTKVRQYMPMNKNRVK